MNHEKKLYYYYAKIGLVFAFIIFAFLSYVYFSNPKHKDGDGYFIKVHFSSQVDGIRVDSKVRMLGVDIGCVKDLKLDKNYNPVLTLYIKNKYKIPSSSSVYIYSDGIFGNKYVEIEPGYAFEYLEPGGTLTYTQGSVILEAVVEKALPKLKKQQDNKEEKDVRKK